MKRFPQIKTLLVMVAALALVVACAACTSNNDSDDSDDETGTIDDDLTLTPTEGGGDSITLSTYVAFDTVQITGDGTIYVGLPSTFPAEEIYPNAGASVYQLIVPDTTAVPACDYFVVYNGTLYFTEYYHPRDAAARNTPLYTADVDGTNASVLVSDVAVDSRPYIIDGVLYYLSYDYIDDAEFYIHDGLNGGTITEAGIEDSVTVLRSYNISTGQTNTVDIATGMLATFVGASEDRVYATVEYNDEVSCMSWKLDFTDQQAVNVTGYAYAVDAAGHILSYASDNNGNYFYYVSDGEGNVLSAIETANSTVDTVQQQYLIYTEDDALVIYDTVNMTEIKRVELVDNVAEDMRFFLYDTATDTVYFYGYHTTDAGTGTYSTYLTSGATELSVFSVDSEGVVSRVE